jgi:hypothetical protein
MSKASKARCQEAITWLKENGHDVGMLTGQDRRALEAITHCWDLCAIADQAGELAAIHAVRDLLNGMQPKCWSLAKELIAHSLDWHDRDRLWDRVMQRTA